MSYKFFTYDITEYKRFENKLNELSKKGINPIEMGYVSSFEKSDKQYFYTIDVLKEEKNNPKKLVRNHLINLYDKYDYRYVGSYGNMIFFRCESQRKLPKGRETIRQNYLENAWTTRMVLTCILFVAVVFTVSYSFLQKDIRHLLTDGEILFQYFSPVLFSGIALIGLSGALRSFQYKAHKEVTDTFVKPLGIVLIVCSILMAIVGSVLDVVERGNAPIDDSILTLETIGLPSKKAGEYSYSESMKVSAKSYLDQNQEGELLFSVVYEVKGDPKEYFETFKEEYLSKYNEEVEKNVYVYKIETENDSMIAMIGNKIIEITSSEDLLKDNIYKKIIKFYQ
ncbi:MAG: DUF2812 domain-containing protein [Firmicutes bacterium]|nr:DUF2812 domain-containing protein [Bacillota bacterium]